MRQRHRGRRVVGWAGAVAVIALLALTARLFVWPPTDRLERSDAILVLGGTGSRAKVGLALAREGYAPLLLVSEGAHPPPALCNSVYHGVSVVCFAPHPYSTRGEARYLRSVTRVDHLHSVLVVSGKAQAFRARLRVGRCFGGRILVDPVRPPGSWAGVYQVVYEWGALLKAVLWQRAC